MIPSRRLKAPVKAVIKPFVIKLETRKRLVEVTTVTICDVAGVLSAL